MELCSARRRHWTRCLTAPSPKDNQYFAWIQDLVSGNRTREELADELRRGCVVGTGDPSRV